MRRSGVIPESARRFATATVDSVRINHVADRQRDGRPVFVKRRTAAGAKLARSANFYFQLAGIPIRYCSEVRNWQRWEVDCFNSLNGPAFSAVHVGRDTVSADRIPGRSLWEYMSDSALTPQMLEAAAHALRRAHEFWSDEFDDWWSHGDATTTNIIYNAETGRAHLIDFEMIHEKSLPPEARHADDLLVLLLDTVRLVPERQWLGFALHFLQAYGKPEVLAQLRTQLVLPRGLARIWYSVRTNFANRRSVNRRLGTLRRALAELDLSAGVGSRPLVQQPATFDQL